MSYWFIGPANSCYLDQLTENANNTRNSGNLLNSYTRFILFYTKVYLVYGAGFYFTIGF
jgi:hypothetical protein